MSKNPPVDLSRYYIVDKDKIRTIYFNALIQGEVEQDNSLILNGVRYYLDNHFNVDEMVAEGEKPTVLTTKGEVLLRSIVLGKLSWWIFSLKKSEEIAKKNQYVFSVVCSGYVCIDYPENPIKLSRYDITARYEDRISITDLQDNLVITNEDKYENNTIGIKIGEEVEHLITLSPEEKMEIPKGTCIYLRKLKKCGCLE